MTRLSNCLKKGDVKMSELSVVSKRASILVVDDTPENLNVLSGMLKAEQYEVRPVPCGVLALTAAKNNPPDLVLLDINMPEMNGYEVCGILKADEKLKDIPVIFISALSETLDKVKAFSSGGIDYVTKPFQFEEVNARVKTHIEISRIKLELKKNNENLERIVCQRTEELKAAYKRLSNIDKLKSEFIDMISHEFRTPLSGLLGVTESLFDTFNKMNIEADITWMIEVFNSSRKRILQLLQDAVTIKNLEISDESHRGGIISLNAIIEGGAEGFNYEPRPEFEDVLALAEPGMIQSAMQTINLLAKCFIKKMENAVLDIYINNENLYMKYSLDNMGMSEVEAQNFFELYSSARCSTHAQKLGLSPIAAQKMLNIFGGELKFIIQENNKGWLLMTIPVTKYDKSEQPVSNSAAS